MMSTSTSASMMAPSIALKGVTVATPAIATVPAERVEDAEAAAKASKARTAIIRLVVGISLFAAPVVMVLTGTVLAA